MSITRKHFEAIARANRAALKAATSGDQAERLGHITGVYEVIVQQARTFKTFNSQFSATLFIIASVGFETEDYVVERLVERAIN